MAMMKASAQKGIDKLKKPIKPKYQDSDWAAFAMAYTPQAQQDIQGLGMTPLGPGVPLTGAEDGKTLKVFRKEE